MCGLQLITTFWSCMRRFANDVHTWLLHSWKSLANHLIRDYKTFIHNTLYIILQLSGQYMVVFALKYTYLISIWWSSYVIYFYQLYQSCFHQESIAVLAHYPDMSWIINEAEETIVSVLTPESLPYTSLTEHWLLYFVFIFTIFIIGTIFYASA